jgi:hypothetical protein
MRMHACMHACADVSMHHASSVYVCARVMGECTDACMHRWIMGDDASMQCMHVCWAGGWMYERTIHMHACEGRCIRMCACMDRGLAIYACMHGSVRRTDGWIHGWMCAVCDAEGWMHGCDAWMDA